MIFKKTNNKPYVNLSIEDRIFKIQGSSYSKSVTERFNEVHTWIDTEVPKLEGELKCSFYFDVINSISYRCLMEIFKKFSDFQKQGKHFNIIWHYDRDDEDNLENAENIQDFFDLPITIKKTIRRGKLSD